MTLSEQQACLRRSCCLRRTPRGWSWATCYLPPPVAVTPASTPSSLIRPTASWKVCSHPDPDPRPKPSPCALTLCPTLHPTPSRLSPHTSHPTPTSDSDPAAAPASPQQALARCTYRCRSASASCCRSPLRGSRSAAALPSCCPCPPPQRSRRCRTWIVCGSRWRHASLSRYACTASSSPWSRSPHRPLASLPNCRDAAKL